MNLSRRGVYLASAILLLAVLAQWLPGPLTPAWHLLGALLLVALAVEGSWAAALSLDAQWGLAQPLRLGRPAPVSVSLRAFGRRALAVDAFLAPPEGAAGQPHPQRLQLGTTAAACTETWTALRLGRLPVPTLRLRLLGGFGLAWWSRSLVCDLGPLRVEPDLNEPGPAVGGRRSGQAAPRALRGAGSELLELRDYQAGDPLRTLAWKASARRGRLLVREFAQDQQLDLMIVIDAGRAGRQQIGWLTRLHHAVNAASRLALRASALGDRVGLLVYDGRGVQHLLAPAAGLGGLSRLQRALSALRASAEDADPVPAAVALRRACPQRALALWFTDVDTGASPAPLRQCAQLLVPRHLPLFAAIMDPDLQHLADRAPQRWKDPYVALAAAQTLDAAQAQALGLRRLGCQVVQAVPQEIDASLLRRYELLRAQRAV